MLTAIPVTPRIAALAALPAALLIAGTAHAATDQDHADTDLRSLNVGYHDLNLASPHDRARLERRIVAAAKQVCDYDNSVKPLDMTVIETRCYTNALADAHARLAPVIAAAEARQKLAGR